MSRNELFRHYQNFVSEHINLKDRAYIVLRAALECFDSGEKPDIVIDKMYFGLNIIKGGVL